MKAVTTIVTDSILTPKMRNSVPLPGELIDQRRKAGKEEQHAQHARPLREPLAALCRVGAVVRSRLVMGAGYSVCRAGSLGKRRYPTLNGTLKH